MLIVNSMVLPINAPKGHVLEEYSKEYQRGLTDLKTRFPDGNITLKRNGYPRDAKRPQGSENLLMMPDEAPPIFMKMTRTDDTGAVWGYCATSPKTEANGLVSVRDNENSEMLQGEMINLDLKNKPDHAFFFWYKSGQIGSNFSVHEPEKTRMEDLREKQERIRVQSLIWTDMDETKFKTVCQAWDISLKDGNKEKPMEVLREEMETKVFEAEAIKQKDKTDLMARGIAEFLADIKSDEITRPKALLKHALDEKKLTYDKGRYYFDGNEICFVPFERQDKTKRQEFLAQYLRNSDNSDKWLYILKALVDKEYIESCDKYGKRWLAEQVGIALNQSEDKLTTALLEYFGS